MEWQTRKDPFHSAEFGDYSVWINFPGFLHHLDVGGRFSRSARVFYSIWLTLSPYRIGINRRSIDMATDEVSEYGIHDYGSADYHSDWCHRFGHKVC